MSGRPTTYGISFGTIPWGAFSQPEMYRWAQSSEIAPMATRVLFAAMSRIGPSGHAPFRPGELADVLGRVDTSTGELTRARASAVSDAIKMAKRLGFVDGTSNARCLVLPLHVFQMGKGGAKPCQTHGL